MNKETQGFILKLIALTGLLCAVHYYIFLTFFSEMDLYFPIWSIYAFNCVLVLIVYGIINYNVSKGSEKAYQLFLILTMIKMALIIVFLLPLFTGKSEHKQTEVINFFVPYFFFLAFEIFSLNKFLQKS